MALLSKEENGLMTVIMQPQWHYSQFSELRYYSPDGPSKGRLEIFKNGVSIYNAATASLTSGQEILNGLGMLLEGDVYKVVFQGKTAGLKLVGYTGYPGSNVPMCEFSGSGHAEASADGWNISE